MNARDAYIALNLMEGIGPVRVRALSETLGSLQAIFEAGRDDLLRAPGLGPTQATAILTQRSRLPWREEQDRVEALGARLVTPADPDYPKPLTHIHDPPLALYVQGTLLPADRKAVAIVGSRHATPYGRDTADAFARQLAGVGFTVVSGLARGIDTAAHHATLKAGGRTLAVLGGALDRLYPEENRALADAIAQQGAVISEFPLGRAPDRTTFPMRNRIVSGLSLGVLVIEAGATSGALITAGQALDQGRSVFAVPGRIDSPAARGSNRLIKNGAKLVDALDDILEDFEYLIAPKPGGSARAPATALPPLTDPEQQIVSALIDGERSMDELSRQTGLTAAAMSVLILGLEMKRVVRLLPGRLVALRRG